MTELREIVQRLADAVGRLDDSTHLVVSRAGSDRFVDEEGSNRFVQFARSGPVLRAESVGERYLSGHDHLSGAQRDALTRLGWQDPDESGNHWRQWEAPLPLRDVAAFALETLEYVHGAQDVEQLRFDAAPTVLAPLTGGFAPDPRTLRMGYWDYDPTQALTCPSCAWTGTAGDHDEIHHDVVDVHCPSCERVLVVAALPTLEETRAAAAAGNPRATAGLADIEDQARARDRARASLLTDPSELPELEGDVLVIDWDVEGAEPDLEQVLRHDGVVLWREVAFYESYRRFEEVFVILQTRYGSRFAGLRPTKDSELYLYGDRLSSPAIVESLNRSVSRSSTSDGEVLAELARMLGADSRDVAAALPTPTSEIDIDDPDGTRWLACGDPALVLVGIRSDEVVIAEPEVRWSGHTPVLQVRAESAVLSDPSQQTTAHLERAASAVADERLRRFHECVDCGESNPPEWMTSGRLCHGCAQRHHGVVF